MMLKEKSNNWTRLKLLLLVPAGLLTLQAFAHPELVVKPFATLNASVLPVMSSKSTTILQNDQKKKSEYYLVDNQGMTNGEYDEFVKKKVARTSVNREGLTNAKGKIVKVVGFWKGDKGYVSFPAIYLELKEGVKMEYKNNMPPPPPPPPLGTVKVYYKDVDKPTSFFINVGDTEIDFQKELDIVYNDNIIKVCIIPDSKEIAERFNEFEAVNKVLKNKVADKVQIGELEAEK